jgi:hypothetical protein
MLPSSAHPSLIQYRRRGPETQIRYILANSKSLEAFVLLVFEYEKALKQYDEYEYFSDDPRSVVMSVADSGYLVDWERGATGGDDYWIQAERFIQKRRSGEIKGLARTIVEMYTDTYSSESEYAVPMRLT